MTDLSRHTNSEHRLPYGGLTETEIEQLVERASQKVMENFYQEVGRTVMQKIFWVLGLVAVSLLIWLAGAGKLKLFQ